MSINGFERTIINPRERPLSSDINQLQSQIDMTIRECMRACFVPHPTTYSQLGGFQPYSGFYGAGFTVTTRPAEMKVDIQPGIGFIYNGNSTASKIDDIVGLDDYSPYYPVYLPSAQTITIDNAPSAGNERVDIIEVALDRRREDTLSRDVLNAASGVFEPTNLCKKLAYSLYGRNGRITGGSSSTTGIGYKYGSEQAEGTYAASGGLTGVPTTTSGYVKIAEILVSASVTEVAQNKIKDTRRLLFPYGSTTLGCRAAVTLGTSPDTITMENTVAIPPGMRVWAKASGSSTTLSGASTTSFTYYIVGGDLTNAKVFPSMSMKSASANNVLVAYMNTPTLAAINSTMQSGCPFDVAIGQTVIYFTVMGYKVGSSNMDANQKFDLICPICM